MLFAIFEPWASYVLGSWQAVLGPGNALKRQRDISGAGEQRLEML
jgi:hypothetical protein